MSFCGECGKKIPDGQTICPECYERLSGPKKKGKKETKATGKGKYVILGMNLALALFAVFFAASLFMGENDGKNEVGTLESWDEKAYQNISAAPGPEVLNLTAPYAESLLANVMPETTAAAAVAGEFIFPHSSSEFLSEEMLYLLTDEQLQLARNEIYARHGRMFANAELQQYFMSKTWYVPVYEPAVFDAMGHSMMNEFELYNLELIVKIENQRR